MTDANPFALAGSLVETDEILPDQNVMHQGIGFPRRPIDNVAKTTTPPLDDSVALGDPMQWMGLWVPGLYYPKGSFTRDGVYASIANVLTLERPGPIPTGDPSFILPAFTPSVLAPTFLGVVQSGYFVTFSEGGFIKSVRAWAPAISGDITYRVQIGRAHV